VTAYGQDLMAADNQGLLSLKVPAESALGEPKREPRIAPFASAMAVSDQPDLNVMLFHSSS